MPVLILHFSRFLYYVLQLLLFETLVVLDPLLPEFLQARGRDKHYVRFQIRVPENLQALRVKIENTDFARVHDSSYGFDGGAIVSFLVLSMFDELSTENIGFELRTGDEMVILSVDFGVLDRTTRV